MRRLTAICVLALVVALAACGDGDDDVIIDQEPRDSRVDLPNPEVVASEVVFLGEGDGAPPPDAAVEVVGVDDLQSFADAYLGGAVGPVEAAVEDIDLDGRVLVGGIVHTGCFLAGGADLAVEDGRMALVPLDVPEAEGDVDCVRAVITVALLAVDPTVVPAGTERGAGVPADDAEVDGQVLELLDDGAPSGPGVVTITNADLAPDAEPLARRVGSDADLAGLAGGTVDTPDPGEGVT